MNTFRSQQEKRDVIYNQKERGRPGMWHSVWPGPRKHRGHISVLERLWKEMRAVLPKTLWKALEIWVTERTKECKQEKGLRLSEHNVILFTLDKFYF